MGGPLSRVLVRLAFLALLIPAPAPGQAPPIEDELVLQTSVSTFIVDAALKPFVAHAKERWGVTLRAARPVRGHADLLRPDRRVEGQTRSGHHLGGESALFDKLAEQKLLVKHEAPKELVDAVPTGLGKPKTIPLKDPSGYWIGTALEPYGLVYHPRVIRRLGVPEPKDWEDLLHPKLKGYVAQSAPTRSSSSHATYEVILQSRGERAGWDWLRRLAGNSASSRPGAATCPRSWLEVNSRPALQSPPTWHSRKCWPVSTFDSWPRGTPS